MMKRILQFLFVVYCLFTSTNLLPAQWIQTNGPSGGQVQSLLVSGSNLFAGTLNGGVYLSTDNGTSWTAINAGLTNTSVKSFAVYGLNLFAGTVGAGVFVSTNNGTIWTLFGMWNTHVSALAVSGTSFFVGTWGGVFRYWFNLPGWTPVSTGLSDTDIHALAVSPASGGSGTNLFAGTDAGVFLSTNDGTSWTAAGLTTSIVNELAVSPGSGGSGTSIFAGTVGGGVFLSSNNGNSWTAVNTGLANTTVNAFAVLPASGGSGTILFAGTGGGVFISTNNGTSWAVVNTNLTNTDIRALVVFPASGGSGANLFAGSWGGGVWRRPLSEIVTSVKKIATVLPAHFSLGQNYPNPFNPATTIAFSLPTKSSVSVTVIDALGREVSVLVSEELSAGTHLRRWDAALVPSGIYFYRLQAGQYTETKKMLLLR